MWPAATTRSKQTIVNIIIHPIITRIHTIVTFFPLPPTLTPSPLTLTRYPQAFSKAEVTAAKQFKEQLELFQERTELAWREMRWIEGAVQKGRNQATVSSGSCSLLPVKILREASRADLPRGLRGSESLSLPPSLSLSLSHTQTHTQTCYCSVCQANSLLSLSPGPAPEPNSGYLRVFPAYTTGLINGTSVRVCLIHVV